MIEGRTRIYKWDNIRGILICLVVIGHFIGYNTGGSDACKALFLFIYSFHMPLFIFIAGYFHRNIRIRDKIIFYCIMGALLRLLIFAVNKFVCGKDTSLNFLTTDGAPWFMFAMAAWIALSWLLRSYDRKFVFIAAVILGCFSGYDPDINDTFALSRIIVFFPFYWAGYCLQGSEGFRRLAGFDGSKRGRVFKTVAGWAVICGWVLICVNWLAEVYSLRPFFTGRNPFSGIYEQTIAGLETRLLCYLISAALCLALIVVVPDIKLPVLTKWGGITLSVYFWHRPIIYVLDAFGVLDYCYALPHGWIIVVGMAILLTFILGTNLCNRPFVCLKKMIYQH